MTKNSQLSLDASKISLCNDAYRGIWGNKRDRITWDNCIQYSALKPGEFLQFRNGRSRRWQTDPPAPEGRPRIPNLQRLEVRLANDQNVFSPPQPWHYRHAYIDLGNSGNISLLNDTGKKNYQTSDHRLKVEPFQKPRSIKDVKLQFRGSDGVWRDEQPDPVPGHNNYIVRVVGAGDDGGYWWRPRSYGFFYFDFKSLKVELANDTGKNKTDRVTRDDRLKITGVARGAVPEFQWSDGSWRRQQPVFGFGKNTAKVRQRVLQAQDGSLSSVTTFEFTRVKKDQDLQLLNALEVKLANDTGDDTDDRVTTDDQLKIGGLVNGAVAEYQWQDESWHKKPPVFEHGKNTVQVRQRADDGSVSPSTTFQFTRVKKDQDRPRLNALEVKLANDTGDDTNDRVTTDDQLKIGGLVKGAVAEYQWQDGTWHKKQPVFELGKNTVEVRQRADDGSVSPSTKFQFTLVQELNALAVKLANDTGDDTNDRITTDDQLKIGGLVKDAVAEYQWPDGSWHQKQPVFEFGENIAKVRQRDRFGSISDVTEFKFEYTRTHVAKPLPVVLENNGAIDVISLAGEPLSAAADRTRWGGKAYATHLKLDNSGGRNFQYQFSEQPGFAWLPYQNKVDLNQYIDTIWVREVNLEGVPVSPPEAFTYEKLADKPPAPSVGLANDSGRSNSDLFTNDLSIAVADWGVSGRLAYRLSVPSAFIKSDSVLHESNWNKGEAPVFWWGYSDQKWDRLADPTKLITADMKPRASVISVDFFSVSESGVPSEPVTLKITYAPANRNVPHASGEKAYVNGVPIEPTGLGVEVVFVKDDGYSKTDKVSSQIFAYLKGWISSGDRIQHRLNGADWTSVESWELASQTNTFVAKASTSRVGPNTVELRHVDAAGNKSGIYEYHYTYDPLANEKLSSVKPASPPSIEYDLDEDIEDDLGDNSVENNEDVVEVNDADSWEDTGYGFKVKLEDDLDESTTDEDISSEQSDDDLADQVESYVTSTFNIDQLTANSLASAFSNALPESSIERFASFSRFSLSKRSAFRDKFADSITSFNPSAGDQLLIDRDWLNTKSRKNLLAVVYGRRAEREASKSKASLVYNQKSGNLFLNGNADLSGWGRPKTGGLLVELDAGLLLGEANIFLV